MIFLAKRGPQPRDVLDSGPREAMMRAITEEPGIILSKLADETGLLWGSLAYHLELLEAAGYIRVEKDPLDKRLRRAYPAGVKPRDSARRIVGAGVVVAEIVCEHPGLDAGEIVARSGLPRRTVYWQIRKLRDQGYLTTLPPETLKNVHPTANLHRLLRSL